MPRIIITVPGKTPQPYQFKAEQKLVKIGRSSSNDIIIDCPSISTLHAELHRTDAGFEIRDLGSTNGLKRDGKTIDVIPLAEQDSVTLGDVTLDFILHPAAASELPTLVTDPNHSLPMATSTAEIPATPEKRSRHIAPAVVFAMLGIAAVLYAAYGIPQRTGEVNEWLLFLGRFHPLIVHFPIGLLMLAVLFEWLGVIRPLSYLRRAVPAILIFGALGATAAVYHGVLLVAGSGAMGDTVEDHLWAGVALSVAMFLLIPLRAVTGGTWRWISGFCYHSALVASILLLMVASHLGGNITHGKEYLVEYMPQPMRDSLAGLPAPVRDFIGLPEPVPAAPPEELTLYDAVFAGPINQYCVACHKPDRIRGGLQMHTLAAILEGGETGPSIVYGDLKASELYTRITLPPDDEFHMPPDDRKGFSDQQTAWFEWWISSGIPGETLAKDITDAPQDILDAIQSAIAEAAAAPETTDDAATDEVAEASWNLADLTAINASLAAGRLVPISRNLEDGILVTTAGAGDAFTDQELTRLEPLAPYIIEADLSRTAVTDGGMATVASWFNLRRLRLDHTAIGDSGVRALEPLHGLESLNLYQTKISNASAESLLAFPALKSLFVGETSLDAATLESLVHLIPQVAPPPAPAADPETPAPAAPEAPAPAAPEAPAAPTPDAPDASE